MVTWWFTSRILNRLYPRFFSGISRVNPLINRVISYLLSEWVVHHQGGALKKKDCGFNEDIKTVIYQTKIWRFRPEKNVT